jgi:hypothetical protein
MGGNVWMSKKTWSFAVDGTSHTVELEHGSFFRGKVVRVDGTLVDKKFVQRKRWLQFTGCEECFEVGGHAVIAYIYLNGLNFKYDLAVDGVSIRTGEPVVPPLPISGWIWPLLFLNGVIILMGGFFPVIIGLIGTAYCFRIARDPKKSFGKRIGWCVVVTLLNWMAYLVAVVVLTLIVLKQG